MTQHPAIPLLGMYLLLLLLSHFSRVQLCETPETAAHQGPTSLGFSRQEHWSIELSLLFETELITPCSGQLL